jgi:hypothetical protein
MYIPLILFFIFMVAAITAFMYYTTKENRVEARRWASIK